MSKKYIVVVGSDHCRGWEGNHVEVRQNEGHNTILEYLLSLQESDEDRKEFLDVIPEDDFPYITIHQDGEGMDIEYEEGNVTYFMIDDLEELINN